MKKMYALLPFLIIIYFLSPFTLAQKTTNKGQNDLSNYDIVQYITTANNGSPDNIIKLDNNSAILLNSVEGKSAKQLNDIGIKFNESQVKLLKNWRLIKEEDNILKTNFPILNSQQTEKLRSETKQIAANLGTTLKNDVNTLKEELKKIHREKNTYSILFSYIIDGSVWSKFEKEGLIDKREVTVEHPFWDGEIWALYPKRKFSCGTNSISDQGIKLSVNWSENTLKNMTPFVADWKNLFKIFDDYVEAGKVKDAKAKEVFVPFGLFNEKGVFTIPVIIEKAGDPLFDICNIISNDIVKEMKELKEVNLLKKDFGFKDNKQTLIIVYHEVMWDLLDYFENQEMITKPVAFADPDNTKPEDISSLVFFVKSSK